MQTVPRLIPILNLKEKENQGKNFGTELEEKIYKSHSVGLRTYNLEKQTGVLCYAYYYKFFIILFYVTGHGKWIISLIVWEILKKHGGKSLTRISWVA